MSYSFPTPKEVPYQVRQKVMNYVFPQKKSLIKRSFLVKTFSGYSLFLGVVILFSRLYLRNSSFVTIPADEPELIINQQITSISMQNTGPKEDVLQEIVVQKEDLDNIDVVLLDTENILAELETLI